MASQSKDASSMLGTVEAVAGTPTFAARRLGSVDDSSPNSRRLAGPPPAIIDSLISSLNAASAFMDTDGAAVSKMSSSISKVLGSTDMSNIQIASTVNVAIKVIDLSASVKGVTGQALLGSIVSVGKAVDKSTMAGATGGGMLLVKQMEAKVLGKMTSGLAVGGRQLTRNVALDGSGMMLSVDKSPVQGDLINGAYNLAGLKVPAFLVGSGRRLAGCANLDVEQVTYIRSNYYASAPVDDGTKLDKKSTAKTLSASLCGTGQSLKTTQTGGELEIDLPLKEKEQTTSAGSGVCTGTGCATFASGCYTPICLFYFDSNKTWTRRGTQVSNSAAKTIDGLQVRTCKTSQGAGTYSLAYEAKKCGCQMKFLPHHVPGLTWLCNGLDVDKMTDGSSCMGQCAARPTLSLAATCGNGTLTMWVSDMKVLDYDKLDCSTAATPIPTPIGATPTPTTLSLSAIGFTLPSGTPQSSDIFLPTQSPTPTAPTPSPPPVVLLKVPTGRDDFGFENSTMILGGVAAAVLFVLLVSLCLICRARRRAKKQAIKALTSKQAEEQKQAAGVGVINEPFLDDNPSAAAPDQVQLEVEASPPQKKKSPRLSKHSEDGGIVDSPDLDLPWEEDETFASNRAQGGPPASGQGSKRRDASPESVPLNDNGGLRQLPELNVEDMSPDMPPEGEEDFEANRVGGEQAGGRHLQPTHHHFSMSPRCLDLEPTDLSVEPVGDEPIDDDQPVDDHNEPMHEQPSACSSRCGDQAEDHLDCEGFDIDLTSPRRIELPSERTCTSEGSRQCGYGDDDIATSSRQASKIVLEVELDSDLTCGEREAPAPGEQAEQSHDFREGCPREDTTYSCQSRRSGNTVLTEL
jgi:hypothetical protein